MRIKSYKTVEDCFDGSSVYSYSFDVEWTKKSIMALKIFGQVDYFPDFPKPFFRLRGNEGWQVKGVEGDTTCTLILPKQGKEVLKKKFEDHINSIV